MKRALLPLCLLGALSCGGGLRPFADAPPMLRDEGDFRAYGPRPETYFSPFGWDGADQMFFRPASRFLAVDPAREASNVNSYDEVPDSSWFTNRLTYQDIAPEAFADGVCGEAPLNPEGPWTISAAKPNGFNPGFIIEDAEGRKFLLKFDDQVQPERATAADILGSRIYWAAGFHVPCNRIVFFERDILRIEEGTTVEIEGEEKELTWELLQPAFEKAVRLPDGRFRATASQFLRGRPIGPWRYEGVRSDDPNDVVPHEERRELRGGYVLAAWINHFDAREQNTLAMWVAGENGQGYVRHNYIDFGDSFGSLWAQSAISRQLGHESYFDLGHLLEDFFSLGAVPRPWRRHEFGEAGAILGHFDVESFAPDQYAPGYPNPAFLQASERDNAWMARIIAGFGDAQVDAIVDAGAFQNEVVDAELRRILKGRRDRILRRWLTRLSPLGRPVVHGDVAAQELCLQDRAVVAGIADERPYRHRGWSVLNPDAEDSDLEVASLPALLRRPGAFVCQPLPAGHPYLIVDVQGLFPELHGPNDRQSGPLRAHLRNSDEGYRLVGIERPDSMDPPGN